MGPDALAEGCGDLHQLRALALQWHSDRWCGLKFSLLPIPALLLLRRLLLLRLLPWGGGGRLVRVVNTVKQRVPVPKRNGGASWMQHNCTWLGPRHDCPASGDCQVNDNQSSYEHH